MDPLFFSMQLRMYKDARLVLFFLFGEERVYYTREWTVNRWPSGNGLFAP